MRKSYRVTKYKNFEALLSIEEGARNVYSKFLREFKDPLFADDIRRVRDEEIEHIALVKHLLRMLALRNKPEKSRIKAEEISYYKIHLRERVKLVNATRNFLESRVKLIFVLEKLDALNQKLRDLSRLKSEFVAITAHQLKNPLTSMKWFFDLLLSGNIGQLNDKQKEYLRDIYSSNERLVNLVDDLLKMSKLEEAKKPENLESVDLMDFAGRIFGKYKPAADGKNIRVAFGAPKVPISVDSYPDILENIIDNLISNAVKYTSAGGSIKIALLRRGENIVFSVADTGIGIPAGSKDKIFEKFFRAGNAKQVDSSGTGLGLSIAQDSAKKLGGKIWFEPNKPKGTIFYFSLPIKSR